MASIQDPEEASAALRASLSSKLKLNVAEAMADYHEKIVDVMTVCSQDFGERLTLPAEMSAALMASYRHILKARRAAGEALVFYAAQNDADMKKNVDAEMLAKETELQAVAGDVIENLAKLRGHVAAVPSFPATAAAPDRDVAVAELQGFLWKVEGDFFHFLGIITQDKASREKMCVLAGAAYDAGRSQLSGVGWASIHRVGHAYAAAVFEADLCGETDKALVLATLPVDVSLQAGAANERWSMISGLLAASVKRWRSAGERTAVAEPDAAPSPAGGELGAPFVPAESDEHAR